MAAVNGFVFACSCVFVVFMLGFHNFITNFEENGCQMTYMFEYPQFVKISFPPNITGQYARYGLYAYSEGQLTEKLRKMKFSGIPVLFVPGNSGSYKQVRSLASVSLRKAINSHMPFHFDYFTIDFNDEYSGLFGGILEDQTSYVHHCILRILKLYKDSPSNPTSVVLIGHSVGGMVAKGVFLNPDFNPKLVKIIITLAAPHKAPVVSFDRLLADYHAKVNAYWKKEKMEKDGNASHVLVVSIGGGQRDIIVRSSLTQAEEADINVLTTAIPTVWLSTDHLCSLWCKELVMVIVQALFDVVDIPTKQITDDITESKYAFEYHLLKRTGGKRLALGFHSSEVYFQQYGKWNEYLRRQFSVDDDGRNIIFTMVRLIDDIKHEWLLAEAINFVQNDWIFACNANMIRDSSRTCNSGINLSNETILLPSTTEKRKMVYINLFELKKMKFSHVVMRMIPTKEKARLNIDIHSSARKLTISPPFWMHFFKRQPIIENTDDSAVFYSVSLPGFEFTWQAYYLHISPHTCHSPQHHAVAVMSVPWSREDLYMKISELGEKSLQLRLQAPKPNTYKQNASVEIQLILDPGCQYTVSIQSSLLDSLGQIVRFYAPMVLPYMTSVLLLTLRNQLLNLADSQNCIYFHSALAEGGKPYYILPVVKVSGRLLGGSFILPLICGFITQFDPTYLTTSNLDFLLLPFILYMVGFALLYLLGLLVWLMVIFNGTAANKIAVRFLARTITGTIIWSEWMLAGLAKLPITAAGFLILLCYSTCGALSLCVGGAFYFLKLCKLYEDYLEDLFKYSIYLLSRFKKQSKNKPKQNHCDKKESENNSDNENNKVLEEGSNNARENITEEKKEDIIENESKSDKEEGNVSDDHHEVGKEVLCTDEKKKMKEKEVTKVNHEDDDNGQEDKKEEEKETSSSVYSLSELHFNFTLVLLWVTVTVMNVPAVLVWAHNYGFSTKLEPDPSFETGVVLCLCAGVLWQKQAPNPNLKYYNVVAGILYVLAVLTLLFSSVSLHHLSPLLVFAFVVITLHQLFAGVKPSEAVTIPNLDTDLIEEKIGANLDPLICNEKGDKQKQA